MYATAPLTPATALQFIKLAPFELRPVLTELSTLPRVTAVGATLMGRPVGLAIAVRGWPASDQHAARGADSARLLSVTVAQAHRRVGVGRLLLTAIEHELAAAGVANVEGRYTISDPDGRVAVEALVQTGGWTAPTLRMVQCRADEAVLESPLMKEQMQLPEDYRIEDWVDLSADDRASIRQRQREAPWFPDTLDPFRFEAEMEVHNSLALRYRGDIVGWLITFRTGPTTMFYRCMFARADLARLGRALALMSEAIRRHAELIRPALGYGEWATPASLPLMVRFIQRHLVPYGATVVEQCATLRTLVPTAAPSAPPPRHLRAPALHPMLDRASCADVCAAVYRHRADWRERDDVVAGFTLGTLARRDAAGDLDAYLAQAAAERAQLDARFGWLYAQLCATLSAVLGAPVALHEQWARPVLHITPHGRGTSLPIAAIHCDDEWTLLAPGTAHSEPPIAFTLCLSDPSAGAGITCWALSGAESVGHDTDEIAALLADAERVTFPGGTGDLVVYEAGQFHQLTPLGDDGSGLPRLTMEGHAIRRGDVWEVFG